MLRVDPTSGKAKWTGSASFKSIASAVLSILIGLIVGAIIVVIVGLVSPEISNKSIGEGMKLVLFGVLSTGRNAAGQLSFGFNAVNVGNMLFRAMPLLMTGLSVLLHIRLVFSTSEHPVSILWVQLVQSQLLLYLETQHVLSSLYGFLHLQQVCFLELSGELFLESSRLTSISTK